MMNWDNMSDMEQVYLYWEFCATNDYTGELLTFTDFDYYMRDIEGC